MSTIFGKVKLCQYQSNSSRRFFSGIFPRCHLRNIVGSNKTIWKKKLKAYTQINLPKALLNFLPALAKFHRFDYKCVLFLVSQSEYTRQFFPYVFFVCCCWCSSLMPNNKSAEKKGRFLTKVATAQKKWFYYLMGLVIIELLFDLQPGKLRVIFCCFCIGPRDWNFPKIYIINLHIESPNYPEKIHPIYTKINSPVDPAANTHA